MTQFDNDDAEADYLAAGRAAFNTAFESAGGVEELCGWAQMNLGMFYALFARTLSGGAAQRFAYADVSDTPISPAMTEEEWLEAMRPYQAL